MTSEKNTEGCDLYKHTETFLRAAPFNLLLQYTSNVEDLGLSSLTSKESQNVFERKKTKHSFSETDENSNYVWMTNTEKDMPHSSRGSSSNVPDRQCSSLSSFRCFPSTLRRPSRASKSKSVECKESCFLPSLFFLKALPAYRCCTNGLGTLPFSASILQTSLLSVYQSSFFNSQSYLYLARGAAKRHSGRSQILSRCSRCTSPFFDPLFCQIDGSHCDSEAMPSLVTRCAFLASDGTPLGNCNSLAGQHANTSVPIDISTPGHSKPLPNQKNSLQAADESRWGRRFHLEILPTNLRNSPPQLVWTAPSLPGIYILPGYLSLAEQMLLASDTLSVYSQAPHRTNLSGSDGQSAPTNHEDLLTKLRWITMVSPRASCRSLSAWNQNTSVGMDLRKCVLVGPALRSSEMPVTLRRLARKITETIEAAGGAVNHRTFIPQATIINIYHGGHRLRGHQDNVECERTSPLISISLGAPCIFLLGAETRRARPVPYVLRSGDVVVLAGQARQYYHGVPKLLYFFSQESCSTRPHASAPCSETSSLVDASGACAGYPHLTANLLRPPKGDRNSVTWEPGYNRDKTQAEHPTALDESGSRQYRPSSRHRGLSCPILPEGSAAWRDPSEYGQTRATGKKNRSSSTFSRQKNKSFSASEAAVGKMPSATPLSRNWTDAIQTKPMDRRSVEAVCKFLWDKRINFSIRQVDEVY